MKKLLLLIFLCAYYVSPAFSDDIITLNLNQPTNPVEFITDPEKGHWMETYNVAKEYSRIEFDLFSFTHTPNAYGGDDVGGGMSYWDGFTYCTSGDITNYSSMGSSDAWVSQQWGCMAGGGIKTDAEGKVITDATGKVLVEKGIPYLVAYWGYWIETQEQGAPCLQTNFTDGQAYEAIGVYIANHPWPYYGNIYGDGFAQPFDKEGDFFKLIIHGLNDKGEDTGVTVEHMLAEFKDGALHQSADWQWVDLSPLGVVNGIYYTMETSDADPIYGPNTAVYFCLDKLQVRLPNESTAPSRPSGISVTSSETTIALSWNTSTSSIGVKGYNIYANETFRSFVTNTEYTLTDLLPYTQYKIEIEAVASDDTPSEKASVTVSTTDETAPTTPINLQGTTTEYTMSLSWDASTDNVAVTGYSIFLNGERQKRVKTTSYTLTGLDPLTSYLVEVEAYDAANNISGRASITLSTLQPTSIEESVSDNPIHISADAVYLKSTTTGIIEIYRSNGSICISQTISNGDNIIDISNLRAGVYIIKYENLIRKIIKK